MWIKNTRSTLHNQTQTSSLPLRKKVMFSLRSVCLSVCPSDNWKSYERILTKFLGGVGHGPGTKWLNLGTIRVTVRIQESEVQNPDSLDYRITDFDEILWRAGGWPRDQLITFWWRSASLSGSGSPFRITIRIQEELPQFYYAGIRRRSVLSEYFYTVSQKNVPLCRSL